MPSQLRSSQEKATSQKWKLWDLIQSPTYGMLYRTKSICKERIKSSGMTILLFSADMLTASCRFRVNSSYH